MFNLGLPTIAVIFAAIAASYGGTYLKGYHDGSASKQAEWSAASQKNIADADQVRKDVDVAVSLDPPARELCADKWNRRPC